MFGLGEEEGRVEELVGSGRLEELDEGRDNALPSLGRKLLDVVLEELLQAGRSYPCEGVVLCEKKGDQRAQRTTKGRKSAHPGRCTRTASRAACPEGERGRRSRR